MHCTNGEPLDLSHDRSRKDLEPTKPYAFSDPKKRKAPHTHREENLLPPKKLPALAHGSLVPPDQNGQNLTLDQQWTVQTQQDFSTSTTHLVPVADTHPRLNARGHLDHLYATLAKGFVSRFNKGLRTLRDPSSLNVLPEPLSNLQTKDCLIQQLINKAGEVSKQARSTSWYFMFLAGTIWSSRRSLPAIPEETVDLKGYKPSTAARWGAVAHVVNRVVSGLYGSWKRKAYLIYTALAGKRQSLI